MIAVCADARRERSNPNFGNRSMSLIHYVMSNSHRPPQDSGSSPGGARGINPNCWWSLNSNASSCLLMLLRCTCILSRCRLGVYGAARSSDRYVARRHPSAELARILTDSRYRNQQEITPAACQPSAEAGAGPVAERARVDEFDAVGRPCGEASEMAIAALHGVIK